MDFGSILAPFGSLLASFGSLLAPFGSIQGVTFTKTVILHSFLSFLIYKAQHARPVVACDVDPPPPSGVQTRRVRSNSVFCKSLNSQTPPASTGPTSAADPSLKNRADVLLSHLRLDFLYFFLLKKKLVQKIIKNRTSIKSSPNLKNLTPGCPKLDFGSILDDFLHPCFDQFS